MTGKVFLSFFCTAITSCLGNGLMRTNQGQILHLYRNREETFWVNIKRCCKVWLNLFPNIIMHYKCVLSGKSSHEEQREDVEHWNLRRRFPQSCLWLRLLDWIRPEKINWGFPKMHCNILKYVTGSITFPLFIWHRNSSFSCKKSLPELGPLPQVEQ